MDRNALWLSIVSVVTFGSVACTSHGALETGTTIRAADEEDPDPPECGDSCPEDCWVDINENSAGTAYVATWHIFEANGLNGTALSKAVVMLSLPGDVWVKSLNDYLPETMPPTFHVEFPLGMSFEVQDPELEAHFILGSPTPALKTCGFSVP